MSRAGVAGVCIIAALAFALGRFTVRSPQAPVDPSGFGELFEVRDPLTRMALLAPALRALDAGSIDAAVAAVEAHQDTLGLEEIRLFMLAWTRFDGPGAFRWAREWPTRWSSTLLGEASFAWGYNDGPAAARALEALTREDGDEEWLASLRTRVMEGWLRSGDTARLGEYVAGVADPKRRRRLTFLLTGEISRDGADALVRWVEGLPDDAANQFKQGAFYHASGEIARTDPQRAAAWLEAHRAAPHVRGALVHIARKWAHHHDPRALFAWLLRLGGEPGEVEDAMGAGYRVWHRRDAQAAEAWLRGELPNPRLDPAVWELVRAHAEQQPQLAIEWARMLDDPETRRRGLIRAGRSLFRRDPEAGEAWLAQSRLSEADRESIRKAPPRMRPDLRRRGADGVPTFAPS